MKCSLIAVIIVVVALAIISLGKYRMIDLR